MKKLKLILVLCLMLVFCQAVLATQTIVTKANELRIDLVKYDPSPVQPGTSTTISFEVINLDNQDINNLEIKLVESYPFTITSDKTVKFSSLKAGEKGTFSFQIDVNEDTIENTYQLSLQYFSEKLNSATSSPFDISVVKVSAGLETSIYVESSEESTTIIKPGQTANVKLRIDNPSASSIRDINVKLDLSATTTPFAPLGMTSEKNIDFIAVRSFGEVSYTLIASPDAEAGLYKVPVTISYYDAQGYAHEVEDIIGIVVGGQPELSLEIESTELTTKTDTGNLILKIINSGTTDVKFMKVKLLESDDLEIISQDAIYIGDVDSDDYETAEFRIKMNEDQAKLIFELDYKDANNIAYSEKKVLDVNLYSPKELGMATGNSWTWIIVLLLIAGSYFAWKRHKKKKKQ